MNTLELNGTDECDPEDVKFIERILKEHSFHYNGDATMRALCEIPSYQGIPDPYPWLNNGFPIDSLLTWDDISRVQRGSSISVFEPQNYTLLTTLSPSHMMLTENYFYEDDGLAVSGTGADAWLKPTKSLAAHFKSMIKEGQNPCASNMQ